MTNQPDPPNPVPPQPDPAPVAQPSALAAQPSAPAGGMHATDIETRHSPEVLPLHRQAMREMDEPRDGVAPTPVWLMMIYFALLMWGGYYLAANAGAFRVDVYNEDPSALYRTEGSASAKKPVDLMALGKRTYNNCTQCHQPDGAGVPGAFPPLDGSERVNGPGHVLAAILLNGLQGEVTVKGETYKGEMPAWNQLSDNEIAGVLTYIRANWSNSQPEVSPALVAAMRSQSTARPGAWSDAALDTLAAQPPPAVETTPAAGAAVAPASISGN